MTAQDPVEEAVAALSSKSLQSGQVLMHLLDTVVRTRQLRLAAGAERSRSSARKELREAQRTARRTWSQASSRRWRRTASPSSLVGAWATAHAWSAIDDRAAAAQLQVEAEMRRRWPGLMSNYDDQLRAGSRSPQALMTAITMEAAGRTRTPVGSSPDQRPVGEREADYRRLLESVGGRPLSDDVANSPEANHLWQTLADAESRGLNPKALLAAALAGRGLQDAKSVPRVLAWRVRQAQKVQEGDLSPSALALTDAPRPAVRSAGSPGRLPQFGVDQRRPVVQSR